jgi:hypothetical protein
VTGLLRNNRLGGALSRAGAALQALAGVDLVVELAHIDRLGGTLSCAGAAGQALVSDNKSHDDTSVCSLTLGSEVIVAHLSQKSITNLKIREYIL